MCDLSIAILQAGLRKDAHLILQKQFTEPMVQQSSGITWQFLWELKGFPGTVGIQACKEILCYMKLMLESLGI